MVDYQKRRLLCVFEPFATDPGADAAQTVVHEVGHALGLRHAFLDGGKSHCCCSLLLTCIIVASTQCAGGTSVMDYCGTAVTFRPEELAFLALERDAYVLPGKGT